MGRLFTALALASLLCACSKIKIDQVKSEKSSGISITDLQKQDSTFGGCEMPDGSCQSYWFDFAADDDLVEKAARIYSRNCANEKGKFVMDIACVTEDMSDQNFNECFTYRKDIETTMTVLTSKVTYLETYVREKKQESDPSGSILDQLNEIDLEPFRMAFFDESDANCVAKGGTPLQTVFENSK